MNILALEQGDDARFIQQIDGIIPQLLQRFDCPEFYLLRMDNWFDYKWCKYPGPPDRMRRNISGLSFRGQVWKRVTRYRKRPSSKIPIPPFHPSRVVIQSYFKKPGDASEFEYCGGGQPIHRLDVTDDDPRPVDAVAPNATIFWFSGNSSRTTRASFMTYLPTEDQHWPWYVGYVLKDSWIPSFFKNISRAEFELITAGGGRESRSDDERPDTHSAPRSDTSP
jgi:hypothetical protein